MSVTAYASVVSLMNVITRYQHPTCPVSFNNSPIQTLLDKVTYLLEFLEKYNPNQAMKDDLETRITSAAYKAEDVIESYYLNGCLAMEGYLIPFPDHLHLCSNLENSITETDLIIAEATQSFSSPSIHNQEETGGLRDNKRRKFNAFADMDLHVLVDSSAPPRGKDTKVELDNQFHLLRDRLAIDQPSLQITPIVGMGGIGKTTLAEKLYNYPYFVRRFDIRGWVTISQQYNVKGIIHSLLHPGSTAEVSHMDVEVHELGDQLYKHLLRRRYLIVIDDIWDTEVWYNLKRFLPDNRNGSRIMLTTRILNVARIIGPSNTYEMEFLDEYKSWNLLSQTIFEKAVCPLELEGLGKKIATSCKGLPLSIVVVGGYLKISEKKQEDWEDALKNVSSIIQTENDGHSREILSWSYKHLPIHLKSCFLYMATFKEDHKIYVRTLINLWVGEGRFLKPTRGKTREDVALEYLIELRDRNLVMVKKRNWNWRSEFCTIHDSLREFCLRLAESEKFFCVIKNDSTNQMQRLVSERYIVHHNTGSIDDYYKSNCSLSMPNGRSLVFNWKNLPEFTSGIRLLRVLHSGHGIEWDMEIMQLVNLRYLTLRNGPCNQLQIQRWFSSLSLAWNLETIYFTSSSDLKVALSIIWELPNLRHLVFEWIGCEAILPDPRAMINVVPINLQTFRGIRNFKCTDEVVKMIPNISELGITYYEEISVLEDSEMSHCFSNMARLHKLAKLYIRGHLKWFTKEPENLRFSPNLKELELDECGIPWENMTSVGSLHNLQVLKLSFDGAAGKEWNSVDGHFQRLRYLSIMDCDLMTWKAECSHFPRLEKLYLVRMPLEEIPLGLGEISSLEFIELVTENISAVISAREILDTQDEDDDLIVSVTFDNESGHNRKKAKELANPKFRVAIKRIYGQSKTSAEPITSEEEEDVQPKLFYEDEM